jgi:hypothetical protein
MDPPPVEAKSRIDTKALSIGYTTQKARGRTYLYLGPIVWRALFPTFLGGDTHVNSGQTPGLYDLCIKELHAYIRTAPFTLEQSGPFALGHTLD